MLRLLRRSVPPGNKPSSATDTQFLQPLPRAHPKGVPFQSPCSSLRRDRRRRGCLAAPLLGSSLLPRPICLSYLAQFYPRPVHSSEQMVTPTKGSTECPDLSRGYCACSHHLSVRPLPAGTAPVPMVTTLRVLGLA